MSSFEWMELQTLTSDIANSRSRLADARSHRDHRLARVLETEIAAAEQRRAGLLAYITTHLASVPPADASEDGPSPDPVEASVSESAEEQDEPAAPDDSARPGNKLHIVVDDAPVPAPVPAAASAEGGSIVWEQLTSGDLELAKGELVRRRAEMLARHAEELKALDADQGQLDTLEQAIDAFMRKFKAPGSADVVALEAERELRMQSHA